MDKLCQRKMTVSCERQWKQNSTLAQHVAHVFLVHTKEGRTQEQRHQLSTYTLSRKERYSTDDVLATQWSTDCAYLLQLRWNNSILSSIVQFPSCGTGPDASYFICVIKFVGFFFLLSFPWHAYVYTTYLMYIYTCAIKMLNWVGRTIGAKYSDGGAEWYV